MPVHTSELTPMTSSPLCFVSDLSDTLLQAPYNIQIDKLYLYKNVILTI